MLGPLIAAIMRKATYTKYTQVNRAVAYSQYKWVYCYWSLNLEWFSFTGTSSLESEVSVGNSREKRFMHGLLQCKKRAL